MKTIVTLALVLAVFASNAQQLTASDLLSKIHCKDTTCCQALFASKGYFSMPSYMKNARVVNYVQKPEDVCMDKNNKPNHCMLTVESWPKGYAYKIMTLCTATYTGILDGFAAEGFKTDMKVATASPGVEKITTAKYFSAKYPGVVLYAGKGEKEGKDACIIRLALE